LNKDETKDKDTPRKRKPLTKRHTEKDLTGSREKKDFERRTEEAKNFRDEQRKKNVKKKLENEKIQMISLYRHFI